jgi:hypothetical protein
VAWLVWHLTRVIDAQVAEAVGDDEVWTGGGWMEQFGLPFTAAATGYGQTSDEVGAVRAGPGLLLGYLDAVQAYVATVVERLTGDDLDRIVDRRWDPPVTLAVRLVSIIDDAAQHAGQAAYAAGILHSLR